MVYPADFDVFKDLKTKRLSAYFPEELFADVDRAHPVGDGLLFQPEILADFRRDFGRLRHSWRGIQGLSRSKQFERWWNENQGVYLTRPVMKSYCEAGMTLGAFFDELHLQFLTQFEAKRSGTSFAIWTKKIFKNRTVLAISVLFALSLEKSAAFFASLLVLGPGVQMVNSYTQPVITPLAQTAQQTGARDLGAVASGIQSWLSNREKLHDVKEELEKTTLQLKRTDFTAMKPAEAKQRWAKFEETFFALFLQYNQTLPQHLRDGRGVFKDLMIFTPVGLAANVATFDTQYWVHKRELRSARPRSADAKLHRAEMKAAEGRIAGALAAWKMFEFMYPEIVRSPASAQAGANLQKSYETFSKSMRFDLYIQQFAGQIQGVLKEMDADFLMRDVLARSGRRFAP